MKSLMIGASALVIASLGSAYAVAQTTTAELDDQYREAIESGLLPPNAKPGECYARVFIPATEKRVARQVLVKEGTERLEVVEAQYEWIEETVEVQSESETLEVVPAKFETREKVIEIEPAREVQEVIEAVYDVVEERVKIREAYTTWKKGEGPIQKYDEATGEIMCLVTIPAEYETVEKRVIKSPARIVKKTVPAKTQTVSVKVMVEPPKTQKITIPAKMETVRVRKLVSPAQVKKVTITPEYETVYETVKDGNGQMEWRPILCSTNASEDLIKRMQLALQSEGYNVGTVDGVLGRGTMDAVKRYQADSGLAQGQITIETLEALNVEL